MTQAAPSHSWTPIDLAALGDTPPPEPSISGFIYGASLTLVYGEPENVKTWLALVVCLEQIRGGRDVLWLDLEMSPQTMVSRLRDLGATDDELARFVYIRPAERIGEPHAYGTVTELLDARDFSVCVIDAMAGALALHGLDGNKGDDVERFYQLLAAPFIARGIAVCVVDHVTKDKETRGRWPIGSQRKLGAADVGLSVEMVETFGRGRTGRARLRVTKDRHGALPRPFAAELELTSDPDTGHITWTLKPAADSRNDDFRPTTLMDRVLDYLSRHPQPISRSTLANNVGGRREYVLKAIDCLIEDGRLNTLNRKIVPAGNVPALGNDSIPLNQANRNVPGTPGTAVPFPLQGGTASGTTFGNDSTGAT